MKNTTPSPGRGWRWLRVGEIFKSTDQYYKYVKALGCNMIVSCVSGYACTERHTFRRRVKKGKR